jgi:hypothetical protein
MSQDLYNNSFYNSYRDKSLDSARSIIPLVNKLINPKSVIDFGCGVGAWLSAWKEVGVIEVLGVDGHPEDIKDMLISPGEYLKMNLELQNSSIGRYDLAQSLEVAEHLDDISAQNFISLLCSASDAVVFGAAIPWQGGTNHINEQWPDYWASLFSKNGYVCYDVIRPHVWLNQNCAYYYSQNTLLYVKRESIVRYPELGKYSPCINYSELPRVHPWKWIEANRIQPLEKIIFEIPASVVDFLRRILRKIIN